MHYRQIREVDVTIVEDHEIGLANLACADQPSPVIPERSVRGNVYGKLFNAVITQYRVPLFQFRVLYMTFIARGVYCIDYERVNLMALWSIGYRD